MDSQPAIVTVGRGYRMDFVVQIVEHEIPVLHMDDENEVMLS